METLALEKDVEGKARRRVEELGGRMPKWVSPGNPGVPDRILLLPNREIRLVEFKRPGEGRKGPRRGHQAEWYQWLTENGFEPQIIDRLEDFEKLLCQNYVNTKNRP